MVLFDGKGKGWRLYDLDNLEPNKKLTFAAFGAGLQITIFYYLGQKSLYGLWLHMKRFGWIYPLTNIIIYRDKTILF